MAGLVPALMIMEARGAAGAIRKAKCRHDRGDKPGGTLVLPRGAVVREPMMRASIALVTAVFTMLVAWSATAQTCLRPKWTECVSFPNGGRHTGVSPAGKTVTIDVPPGSEICVITEWEVRAETYAQFARNGVPWWPDRDWEVDVESFCFFKN